MKKLAIIEDNPDNRLLLDAMLSEHYQLKEYETGLAALKDLPQNIPDLILLDISLPGMDGTEVLELLRQENSLKDIPVIALTAHAMSGDREKYLEAGFDEYLSKPIIDESVLIGLIESLLSR